MSDIPISTSMIRRLTNPPHVFATLLAGCALPAAAQYSAAPAEQVLDTITVRSTPLSTSLQALPASASVLDGEQVRDGQLQVNLSESLGTIPGLQVKNRQNYAQDLQLSVRGYGARSTFGVRGVRLYVDGIPATMPDGAGSLSHVDMASIGRIEMLRGPYSALYGNSAGGVLSIYTTTPEGPPVIDGGITFGSYGQKRLSAKASGQTAAGLGYVVSASRFTTDGYRDHSAADRNLGNLLLTSAIGDDARLTIVANTMTTDAQDPQGLTWSQYLANPRQASRNQRANNAPVAELYNTRKSLKQTQAGATYERRLDRTHNMAMTVYAGRRTMAQYQSIPPATQAKPAHAGGVIDMSRDYGGMDARWTGDFTDAALPFSVTAGLAVDHMKEDRKGYTNFIGSTYGIKGELRRDEDNTITSTDPYIQATWQLAPRWRLDTGLRYSNVKFSSRDRYIATGNPDDSGDVTHRKLLPVVSLSHQVTPEQTLYASVGRGFETPTFAELSYRPDGNGGLNLGLQPSVSKQYELGYRQQLTGQAKGQWSTALFYADTSNEIVSNQSDNGRTTYRNAGNTTRQGAELQADLLLTPRWQLQAAYTYLDAQFKSGDISGNMLPGLSKHTLFLATHYHLTPQWRAGLSAQHGSKLYVNDGNSAAAPAYTVAAAHVGYNKDIGQWTMHAFARVDNLFNRQYVGSVIVNDGNDRYYESAPGRNWITGVNLRYRF